MDLQRDFLKIHAMKKEQDRGRISLKEGSSLQPLRQGNFLTELLQQSTKRKTSIHLHPL